MSGATKYNINVKKASETDYNNPSFTRSGITTNSVSVTGLDPGTEYQFQIQAANGTSTSSWSKSSSSTFKTLADLTITNGTYFGTTTLTKGVPYTFKATIKNNASVAWKGGIYLKSGSEDIDKTGLSLSAGSSSTVTLSYTPTTTGSKTFTLYYLTNDNGSGVVINGGNYSNPFTVTIQAPSTTPNLSIAGGSYFNTTSLTLGKAYTFAIKVKNNGTSAWNGSFYLKNGSEDWLSWGNITIEAGATKTLTDSYTPKTAGNKTLTFYYQTGNSGDGVPVSAGSYQNPFSVTVTNPSVINPSTPSSPSPSDRSTNVATSGTFSWSTAANDGGSTLNYDLYVDYNSSFSNVSKPYRSGSGKSCSFSGLNEGNTYYWKVIVYNGSGGHAASPVWSFTTKAPSTTKLATPTNVRATNPTSSSFRASWGAVSGATKYLVYVYQVGKTTALATKTVATTYTDISGLSPSTSYYFEVKAKNDDVRQNSEWSSKSNTITTTSVSPQSANLSIFKNEGFDGSTKMIVGQSYHYSVIVKNNGSETWKGSFYLKEGTTNVHPWYGNSIPSTWGQPLECDYTPKTAGSHTLTLYYQTGGSGDGVPMGDITVNAIADPTVNSSIKLKSAIVYPSTLELGKKGTVSATVQNTGSSNWEGKLFITDNGIEIASVEDIPSGGTKTVYTTSWEPNIPGTHTLAVYYKSKGGSSNQVVAANGFVNPVVVTVTNANALVDASSVVIKHVTAAVEPSEVTYGTVVIYHYKLLDENGRPLRNMRLRFKYVKGSQERYVDSTPSDAEGYAQLCLATSGSSAVANRGETANLECIEAITEGNKIVSVKANDSEKKITLKVLQGSQFVQETGLENVEKVKITITPGVTLSSELNLSKIGLLKQKAKAKGSVGIPIGLGFKWDNYGNVKEYSLDAGITFKGSISSSKDKEQMSKIERFIPSVSGNVGGGLKVSLSSSSPKEALIQFVKGWVDNYTEGTDWKTDLAVKAMRKWFADRGDLNIAKSGYYSFGAGISGDVFKNWPGAKEMKELIKPVLSVDALKLGVNGNITIEPWKTKYSSSTGVNMEGYSSAVKLGGEFDFKGKVHDLVNLIKVKKAGLPESEAYFREVLSDEFFYGNLSLKYSSDFSMKHEEMYNKSTSTLEEVSQQMSLSSSWDFSTENIQIGDILTDGWKPLDLSLGYTSKYTQKVTSTGEWARFLHRQVISENQYKDVVLKVFPNLSYKTYFAPPYKIYNTWQNDFDQPLATLARITPNPDGYKLKDALKFERTVSSEFDASVSVKVYDLSNWCKFYIDTDLNLELENKSNDSYFSVPDRRTFDIVLRPTTSIKKVAGSTIKYAGEKIYQAFKDEYPGIMKAWDLVIDSYNVLVDEYGNLKQLIDNSVGDQVEDFMVPVFYHYYKLRDWINGDRVKARRIILKNPALEEKEQEDICRFSFGINKGTNNFNPGVRIETPHHYPAGALLGVTDQGDTLFVVSEVVNLMAIQGTDTLNTSQNGQFEMKGIIGADDLTPFGFREDQPLDVYYSEDGSKVWHYVGPAGTTLYTDKLGAYMMATSIKNDPLAPVVEATLYDDTYTLHIHVSDNIAVRTSSLRVFINGESREFTMLSESDFEVQLTSKDVDYMMTVFVTANDLAGNQGRLFQMFNLDKPDSIEQIDTASEKQAKIHLNKSLLKVENAEPNITVTLFSLKGEVIAKGETDSFGKVQIRLNRLPAGIYIATLSNGKSKKFSVK